MKTKFKVSSCTETRDNQFLIKLVSETASVEIQPGVVIPGKKSTFYLFLAAPLSLGMILELDLDKFEIILKEYEIVDEGTGESKVTNLKYLFLKEDFQVS